MPTIRTRNAPSPTGIPHIGNTRTALYDYLLAKKYGGQFVLRIEDTDQKRLVEGAVEKIYEIHHFLGLIPDESPEQPNPKYGPYVQTQRLDKYKEVTDKLLELDVAYRDEGAIRVKIPKEGYTVWKDLVQGKISIPNKEVDDKVLMKSNGIPTYHLAVVVDDHDMEITHVLRGVEWIVSTPVHLFLYHALGWKPPVFGHLPLLLGPDRTKLSKRHGAKSVLEFRDEGYLPEAINNFLFYLGFSYHDNSELLTMDEMVRAFDETRLQKQNAIFDIAKLNYFNGAWIRKLSDEEIVERIKPYVDNSWKSDEHKLLRIIKMVKTRMSKLTDFVSLAETFYKEIPVNQNTLLKDAQNELVPTLTFLSGATLSLERNVQDWNPGTIEQSIRGTQAQYNWETKPAFMTIRTAVTGKEVTPPLTETMAELGKTETIKRLNKALEVLKT